MAWIHFTAVALLYLGLMGGLVGLVSLVWPLGVVGLTNRVRALVLVLASVTLVLVGWWLPAAEQQVGTPCTVLDEFSPRYQFWERHTTRICAPRERIYAAIKSVPAEEILLFRTLVWIRRFGQPGPESILNPPPGTPILDVATRTSFLLLADQPPRELVVGTLVAAPESFRRKAHATPADFKALAAPGFAKAVMNFVVEDDDAGCSRVATETRVFATDAGTRRKFAGYWRVIYPGSAVIRRMWLRAIARRATIAT